jgi:hypothetical protein
VIAEIELKDELPMRLGVMHHHDVPPHIRSTAEADFLETAMPLPRRST